MSKPMFPQFDLALVVDAFEAHRHTVHVLSVHLLCMQFAPDGSKVILHPNPAYIPKVPPLSYRALACELMFASTEQQRLNNLSPVHVLHSHPD